MMGFGRRRSIQDDLLTFSNEMSSLLALNAPMDKCLQSVASQLGVGAVRRALESAVSQVSAGVPLSRALSEHPRLFPDLYLRSLAAGEASGDLASTFSFLSKHLENKVTLERKLKGLSVYPLIVVCVTGFVVWLLLTWLVPVFENVINAMSEGTAKVPLPMQILITISNAVTLLPWWLSLFIGVCLAVLVLMSVFGGNSGLLSRLVLSMPLFSRVQEESTLAIITGVMGTSLKNGLTLEQSLTLARDSLDNPALKTALAKVAKGVQQGEKMGVILERTGKFPPTFTWLVSLAEEEGKVGSEMLKLSERYFMQARDSLGVLSKVLEPALITGLCGIVGIVVFILFWALISMPGIIPLGGF